MHSPLYIFISMTVELLLRSLITGSDDDIQWSELFLLRVCIRLLNIMPDLMMEN